MEGHDFTFELFQTILILSSWTSMGMSSSFL